MAQLFGFVGPAYTAPSIYQDAQELINWFIEKDPTLPDGARGQYTLYPTPGLTSKGVVVVAEGRGMRAYPDGSAFMAVFGNAVYSVTSAYVSTFRGTLLTSTGALTITDNGTDAYFCDGANRYTYNFATNTLATVSAADGAFTGGGRSDTVDGYIVYGRPDSQQWAATDSLSTVTSPLSFDLKLGNPDNLAAVVVNNRLVYLLGTSTSEVWINTGGTPFPFTIIQGSSSQHGLAAENSIAPLGDSFAFVSQDRNGQGLILQVDGYSMTQISTHAVTQDLLGQVISDAVAYTYQIEGHEMYVVNFPTADKTWVYDLSTKQWHKWLSVDSFGVYHRHRVQTAIPFGQKIVGIDYQNGKIYEIDNAVYTEAGATIRRLRRCPHLVADFKRMYFNQLQIQFQPGVGLVTGQGSSPQAMLRWSNDGGSTWSNEIWKSIGAIGQYQNRIVWRRLGSARDRVFEVVVTDPVKAVIVSADLEAAPGAT